MAANKLVTFANELKATFPGLNANIEEFDNRPFTHKVMIWIKDISFEVYFDGTMLYRTNDITLPFNGINDALDWTCWKIMNSQK